MTELQVWGPLMSDQEFAEISTVYFKKRFWNLHEGCCLIAKVDPSVHPGVGEGYEGWLEDDEMDGGYDYTRRPFLVALRSINAGSEADLHPCERPKLTPNRVDEPITGGKSIIVDVAQFVEWSKKRWPNQSGHFEAAWNLRQIRKAASEDGYLSGKGKVTKSVRAQKQMAAFFELLDELGPQAQSMSNRQLSIKLEARISMKPYVGRAESLRKKLDRWRAEKIGSPKIE